MAILFNPDLLPELIGEILSHCARFELSQLALINKEWYQRIRPLLECDLHAGITYQLNGRAMVWQGKESYGETFVFEALSAWFKSGEIQCVTNVHLTTNNCTLLDVPGLVDSVSGLSYDNEKGEPSLLDDSAHIATSAEIAALGPVFEQTNAAQKALYQRLLSGEFHGVVLIDLENGYICCIADYPALCDELKRVEEIAWRHNVSFNFELTQFCPLSPRPL